MRAGMPTRPRERHVQLRVLVAVAASCVRSTCSALGTLKVTSFFSESWTHRLSFSATHAADHARGPVMRDRRCTMAMSSTLQQRLGSDLRPEARQECGVARRQRPARHGPASRSRRRAACHRAASGGRRRGRNPRSATPVSRTRGAAARDRPRFTPAEIAVRSRMSRGPPPALAAVAASRAIRQFSNAISYAMRRSVMPAGWWPAPRAPARPPIR